MSRRLALITGGTSGIGAAIARALAGDHDLALCHAANTARAEAVRETLADATAELAVRTYAGALVDDATGSALLDAVQRDFGRAPAVVVCSAGRLRDALFLRSGWQPHNDTLAEHLMAPMALCRRALEPMYRARWGRIVLVSSIAARFSKRGQVAYATAKAGLEGFARALALEVAHRGVTVNAVAPGLVDTPMTAALLAEREQRGLGVRRTIPAGRAGTPDDVAGAVQFLVSDAAAYVTGAVLTVDGGRSLGEPQA